MKRLLLASTLALAACAGGPDAYTSHDETPTDKAVAMCNTYGFKPGTEAYSGCLQTEIERQHQAIANAWGDAARYMQSIQPRMCNTYGTGTLCY